MIRLYIDSDFDAVTEIWQEAFGDSKEEINRFIQNFGRYIAVFVYENRVVSMLSLIPVKIGEKLGRYIYAVATRSECRKKGYASELLEFAKKYILREKEEFLVILPQKDSLYGFYGRFGFTELYCVGRINQKSSESKEYTVKIIGSSRYYMLRDNFFDSKRYVKWDEKTLDYIKSIYKGEFAEVRKNGNFVGCALCFEDGEKLIIREMLGDDEKIPEILCCFWKKTSVTGIKACQNGERFAMIYPEEYNDVYFGLGMN